MSSLDEAGDRVAILQMNAELRHAQLELLSAQCASDRLRLRYSAKDIAHHAQRDILRKAWSAANALCEYYNGIASLVPDPEGLEKSAVSDAKLDDAITRVADFMRAQREIFRPNGLPLDRGQRQAMKPFFSAPLLEHLRTIRLNGKTVPTPPFYAEARAIGIKDLPDMTHMATVTFEDVLVFPGEIATRTLFHALVHSVQFEVLGLGRYAECFVRGFMRTRTQVNVPLEAHAFLLESEFAGNPAQPFSVEERVRLWTNQGRY